MLSRRTDRTPGASGSSESASVSPLKMKTKSAAACSPWARKNSRFRRAAGLSLYTYVMRGRSSGSGESDAAF